MKIVAFIPLRGGGKRVGLINGKDKEQAIFAGHPLMAYTICAAKQSGVFDEVVAVTCSIEHAVLARQYGALAPCDRPKRTTKDDSPDIEWVKWEMSKYYMRYGAFAILRVTSPFRGPEIIQNAWKTFYSRLGADSLRMVRPVTEHPGKMWIDAHGVLLPLLNGSKEGVPWHSCPTQSLFQAYIQTAGMEFAYFDTVSRTDSISGSVIVPYISDYWTGFDINTREEWNQAERAALAGIAKLSEVN